MNRSSLIEENSINQDFETWFMANGGYLHPHIELTSNPISRKSLHVKSDHTVSPSSTIVACPHTLALSWPNASRSHFPEVQLPQLSQRVATRFFLMKQRLLKETSSWWPYIRILPLTFDTPLYYDSEDMAWINGTNLGRARKVREDAWRDEYEGAMNVLFPKGTDREQREQWNWWVSTDL